MKIYFGSTMYGNKEEDLVEQYPWLKEFEYHDGYITIKSLEELMELRKKWMM